MRLTSAASLSACLAGCVLNTHTATTSAHAAAIGQGAPHHGDTVGQVSVTSALPAVATMENVLATQNDDSVSITFEPVDDALDYRVYALPEDSAIHAAADGHVTVTNALYRCAGNRESPHPAVEDSNSDPTNSVITKVNSLTIGTYTRTDADATLGYVYTQPAAGLVPVYVLGDPDPLADADCSYSRWAASRAKIYTASDAERASELAAFARDDGIAFYVPATSATDTVQVYRDDTQWRARYYFAEGAEAAAHTSQSPVFSVLTTPQPGTKPLMRVYYVNDCGFSHDELVVGQERFKRAYHQGDEVPNWNLTWTGLTGPTTLVVEALDGGCPYQAQLAAQTMPAIVDTGTTGLNYQAWSTIDDVRAAAPDGEVFINGQLGLAFNHIDGSSGPAAPKPKAIARAFIDVAPASPAKMDFLETFASGDSLAALANAPTSYSDPCTIAVDERSSAYDLNMICPVIADWSTDHPHPYVSIAPVLGELWVNYADVAADTNGKFRLTPQQKATMSAASYLHVTMEVDMLSTSRRYPQILISDADAPIQGRLDTAHTLIVQSRAGTSPWADWPIRYELQVCSLRTWDVNNQCPGYDFHNVMKDDGVTVDHLAPNAELGESASADHRAQFDVYASTSRVYLFFEGQPFACADVPEGQAPEGPVTVTWGDTLYHSGVDNTFQYHKQHLQIETHRHFDNLGFSSGVSAPAWDERRLPCVPAGQLHAN